MSADFLYWLGSTVAQSVVALVAFGAFIGVWRRDVLWQSIAGHFSDLASACLLASAERSMRLDQHYYALEFSDLLAAINATSIHANAVERVAEYEHATDPDEQLEALISACAHWLAVEVDDERPESPLVSDELRTTRKLHPQLIAGRRTLASIRTSLIQLSLAGLWAFGLSLVLMALAEPATVKHAHSGFAFAGFAVLALLTIATALTVAAAANLARASFGQTGAPSG